MKSEIQVLAWDRHTTVAGLNLRMFGFRYFNVMWGDLMRSPLQVKHINDSIFIKDLSK
jgi:hypothetical protein